MNTKIFSRFNRHNENYLLEQKLQILTGKTSRIPQKRFVAKKSIEVSMSRAPLMMKNSPCFVSQSREDFYRSNAQKPQAPERFFSNSDCTFKKPRAANFTPRPQTTSRKRTVNQPLGNLKPEKPQKHIPTPVLFNKQLPRYTAFSTLDQKKYSQKVKYEPVYMLFSDFNHLSSPVLVPRDGNSCSEHEYS